MKLLYNLQEKIRENANRAAGCSRKLRGEYDWSKIQSDMGKCPGNLKQRYVYHPGDLSKLTCLIRGPGN